MQITAENILSEFKTWLEKQPQDKTFRYNDVRDCLICRFLADKGYTNPLAGGRDVDFKDGDKNINIILPPQLRDALSDGDDYWISYSHVLKQL